VITRLQATLLVAAVAALLVLPPLGQRVLAPSDEARFVLYARDVLERQAPFDVQVRAKLFREKPPLLAWLIALASVPGGRVTEATAQLPVALAALAAVVFTFLIGDRLLGTRAGLPGGLALAVTYGFFAHSQLVLPDMLVVAFVCAAMHALVVWRHTREPSRLAPVAFYVATAAAVYAKGPVGLLPFLIGGVWLWSEQGPRGLRYLWHPGGALAFALVTLTWVVPFLTLGGQTFAETVIWEDWIRWYVGRPRIVNLLIDTAVMCLPWTLVLPLVLAAAIRRRRGPIVRLLLAWFLVSFLVILPIANQRTRYLLPMTPPLALLVAWWATVELAAFRLARRVVAALILAAGCVTVVALAWPESLGAWQPRYLAELGWSSLPFVIATAALAASLAWGLYAVSSRVLMWGTLAAMALLLAVGIRAHNRDFNAAWDFPGLAAAVERQAQGGDIAVFGGRWFALDYYLGRPVHSTQSLAEFTEYALRPERPVMVTNQRTWNGIRASTDLPLCALDARPLGSQTMVILRASLQCPPAPRTPASSSARP
jgi:4-amino-4-deoxy-L-arabinose transferase-like glycosyltransferase